MTAMKLNLKLNTFSLFKVLLGSAFLLFAILVPLAGFFAVAVFMVGRTHALGAWLAMWRAKKLNWKYVTILFFMTVVIAYIGLRVVPVKELGYFTYLLFAFHFFFDEFDLQEEKRAFPAMMSAVPPYVTISLYLLSDFFNLLYTFSDFLLLFVLLTIVEFFFVREISWFFVNTKVLSLFILSSIFFHFTSTYISGTLLMFHYLFWFIYPVYKLHKYKREERDGFIMILLLITFTVLYFAAGGNLNGPDQFEIATRGFMVATIIHIFSTAPFGYFIGLPRQIKYS